MKDTSQNGKAPVIRVSNSFTRNEIRMLKEIIDTATTADFRGRNHLMKFIENQHFSQLYRKLHSMQEKADRLHSERNGGKPTRRGGA
ncbi:MAG: hypothetical protein RIT45_1533 [Pseudomonadota bacterium]